MCHFVGSGGVNGTEKLNGLFMAQLMTLMLAITTVTRHCLGSRTRKPGFLGKDKADGVHLFHPKTTKRVSFFFMDACFCTASGCLISLSSLDLCKIGSKLGK